ncbi:MAG: hypothetical protein DMF78_15940 [Acidobacteria bacterium]|nr:MAG: hypothetical protein DMF78_15940 [Acidobacteriota bacterium]
MFIGHFALAYAAERVEPDVSVGTSMAAAQLCDLLWPWLLLAGVEKVSIVPGDTAFTPLRFDSYPISHSLVTVIGWGALFGGVHWWRKRRLRAAALLAALVVSHWVLDFVTHRPDLPLAPWSQTKVGLGLWNSMPATLTIEIAMYAAGVWLYLGGTRALDAIGRWGATSLALVLFLIYLASSLGPPPPSWRAVALSAAPMLLLPLWGGWADRHRATAR